MDYYYAQINENKIVHAVSKLCAEVEAENMIRVSSYDFSLLGKKYENGEFFEVQKGTIKTEPSLAEINEKLDKLLNEKSERAEKI